MFHPRMLQVIVALSLSAAATTSALGQEPVGSYPSRPVTMISPLVPGGGGDLEVRLYNQRLTEHFGKPFITDYKPGAGTSVGTGYVAKSKPDGYTLLGISTTLTIVPAFYTDLPYDVNRDLTAIAQMTTRSSMLAVNPSVPARDVAEFVAYLKANPDKLNWGTHGAGSASHLTGAWFQSLTGTRMTFVHYKGSNPLQTDVIAGRAHATNLVLSSSLQHAKSGKIRVLGISSTERSALLPDVPTVMEQGLADFEYPSWFGIFGPGGMTPALASRIHGGLAVAGKHPETVQKLGADGTVVVARPPEDLKKLVAGETARWKKLAAEQGIKIDE